jgi:hypothetical protein
MPCLLVVVALFLPRVTLFFMWLLTGYLGRAYQTALWPLAGFFFMPYTTLVYALALNEGGGLHDYWLALLILGVLADGGQLPAARWRRRQE